MKAFIHNERVIEIIPDIDPIFPDIPINERFSIDFLNKCIDCDETVRVGMNYIDGVFSEPTVDQDFSQPISNSTEEKETYASKLDALQTQLDSTQSMLDAILMGDIEI